jgi:8-oxo-dGTP diphosphatase
MAITEIYDAQVVDTRPVHTESSIVLQPATRQRRSARIILLSSAQQVLLIRFVIERGCEPFEFWATPGGAVEQGETDLVAAQRELNEELGLDILLAGPIYCAAASFEYEGETINAHVVFFVGRCEQQTLTLKFATPAERAAMKEIRWWSVAELETTSATVFPPDLAKLLRTVTGDRDTPL